MPERDHNFSLSDYYLQVCFIIHLFNSTISSKLTQQTNIFPALSAKLKEILHSYDYCSLLEKPKKTMIKSVSLKFNQMIPIVRFQVSCASVFFPPTHPISRATILIIQDLLILQVPLKAEGNSQELLNSLLGKITRKNSQNHGRVEVGRYLWRWLPRTMSRMLLKISKEGGSAGSLSILCLCSITVHSEKVFWDAPVFQFVPIASYRITWHHTKEPGLVLTASLQGFLQGHLVVSWSTWCPPESFLQSCFPAG